ncbi:MAG: AAA family ATPase [Clostridiaceae bacterium]|nr:AAA family ATPase [Clostridiaceae bacterium]
MRPKLLEIEGLQSFTDAQVIDFETLGETGLFGIFGPTGSGKSTILDAITFALYGRVKRAENGTQGIINSRRDTCRVSFTFELNRDGKRKTYRVERTYRRRRNSPNSCEPRIARLTEVTDAGAIPLCDKATEVTRHVRELLGLNSEDFTRAVVLPQNSFHEFLMLKNSERRAMLERLFYLEEYGKLLNDRISRKLYSLRSRMDVLTGELMGYADASDEALEEAKAAMEAAEEEKRRTQKELKKLEKIYNESKEVWDLVCELADLERREEVHRRAEAEISEKRVRLDRAVRAESLADMVRRNRELETKLSEARRQLEEVMAVLPGIGEQLELAKTEYENAKKDAALKQRKLVEQRTRLQDALGIRAELEALAERTDELRKSVNETVKAIKSKDAEIGREKAKLEGLENRLRKLGEESERLRTDPGYRQKMQMCADLEKDAAALEKSLEQLAGRKEQVHRAIDGLEKQLADMAAEIDESMKAQAQLAAAIEQHEEGRTDDRDSVMKSLEKVHRAQGVYQVLKLREDEAEAAKARVDELKAAFDDRKKKAEELEKKREEAAKLYDDRRRKLDECLKEREKNTAWLLSRNLKEGEPCPVCGSLEHPAPAAHGADGDTAALEREVEAAQNGLKEAEAALKDMEREALIAAEDLRAVSGQLEQAVKELEKKNMALEDERQKLPDEWRSLGTGQIRTRIEKADARVKERLKEIEAWESRLSELRKASEEKNEVLAKQRMAENGIRAELRAKGESLAQIEAEMEQVSGNLVRIRQELSEKLAGYTVASAAAELARLSENDRLLEQAEAEAKKTRKEAEETVARINGLNEERGRLDAERIRLEADISGLGLQRKEKERRLYELSQGADIEESLRRTDSELESLARKDREHAQRIAQLEKQYNELNMSRSRLESSVSLYSESLAADSVKLSEALAENGFDSPEEAEKSLVPKEEQKAIRAEIEAYDQESVNLKAHRKLLEKKLGSRTITEEEWRRTEQSYNELLERSNRAVSDCEVAKSNFENISRKNARWKEIRASLDDISHRHGLYDQIQRLLKASHGKDNSFIDYIAEERLRYIAAKASTMLQVMTRQRYTLELDAESGFIVRDDANGGIHRAVSTLSGGETFLTSLSLALALSEQIQLKGQSPLEFFFLDEGFGTLDQKLLDLVMDSLERLCSESRVIGIISHVPEVRQRIGRCLIVTPPTFEGTGSIVRMEKS